MKQAFVHSAELVLDTDADPAAPGGAVTIALCGSWDHEGACKWPHHTQVEPLEGRSRVRVVFVAESSDEADIRSQIDGALAGGSCTGPDGRKSQWSVVNSGAGTLTEEEVGMSERMAIV